MKNIEVNKIIDPTPASDGAGGIQIFLNGVLLCILPLAVPLYAHPPLKHKFLDLVFLYNLFSNYKLWLIKHL